MYSPSTPCTLTGFSGEPSGCFAISASSSALRFLRGACPERMPSSPLSALDAQPARHRTHAKTAFKARLLFPANVDAVGVTDGREQQGHEFPGRAARFEDIHGGAVDEVVRVSDVFFFELVDEHLQVRIADRTQVTIAILQE